MIHEREITNKIIYVGYAALSVVSIGGVMIGCVLLWIFLDKPPIAPEPAIIDNRLSEQEWRHVIHAQAVLNGEFEHQGKWYQVTQWNDRNKGVK
jgi:hypothetical protein